MKNEKPLPYQDEATTDAPAGPKFPSSLVHVDLAARSHQGYVRSNNEDRYLTVRIRRSLETLETNLEEGVLPASSTETAYGMLVADGMGGMAAGEVASTLALQKLVDLGLETSDWVMRIDQREDAAVLTERMTQRFRKIDDTLREKGDSDPALRGMGTTLTVAASLSTDLLIGHIGDSRAYLLRTEHLHQLTHDHTLAQALVDAGIVGAEDPATHAMRHVLTAALGSTGERSDPQIQRLHLNDGDQILLCTDGLTEMVAEDVIDASLRQAESAAEACQSLIDLALAGGGTDNVTVVLARYHFPKLLTIDD